MQGNSIIFNELRVKNRYLLTNSKSWIGPDIFELKTSPCLLSQKLQCAFQTHTTVHALKLWRLEYAYSFLRLWRLRAWGRRAWNLHVLPKGSEPWNLHVFTWISSLKRQWLSVSGGCGGWSLCVRQEAVVAWTWHVLLEAGRAEMCRSSLEIKFLDLKLLGLELEFPYSSEMTSTWRHVFSEVSLIGTSKSSPKMRFLESTQSAWKMR